MVHMAKWNLGKHLVCDNHPGGHRPAESAVPLSLKAPGTQSCFWIHFLPQPGSYDSLV